MSIKPYATCPPHTKIEPEPFTIHISDERLSKLKQLVQLSEIPPETFESKHDDFNYGLPHSWLTEAKDEWENKFDWRERETYWNTFPNFKMPVKHKGDTFTVHFVALFSEKPDAVPIALFHGWPGSFIEFLGLMTLLKDRYKPAELPYHIIVPSLPGWGFSSPPPLNKDFTTEDATDIMNGLLVNLGFDKYVSQGGDVGSYIARMLGVRHQQCVAAHVNFCLIPEPKGIKPEDVTEEEQQGLLRARNFTTFGTAYAQMHATRPSTAGLVLSSSPLAFMAWIAEKFHTWSDDPSPSTTEILSTASLYWLTQTISTSIYTYRQVTPPPLLFPVPANSGAIAAQKLPERADGSAQKTKSPDSPEWYLRKPMGYSWFHKELGPMPVAWVRTTGDLVWWRRHDKGGHFAALEQPALLLGDVEDFVKQVWK